MLSAARRNTTALILGLLSLAYILPASVALECKESFYKNTPPQRVAESGLDWRCRSLGAGRTFVLLHHPGHQSAVYTALHLGQHNAWGKGTSQELDKLSKAEGDLHGHIPALYRKDRDGSAPQPASPFHKLDGRTAELVESRTVPLCSKAGGSLYVQSGVGGLSGTKEDVLWSAVCCDVSGGPASFSIGAVHEGEGELKLMSVKELEVLLGFKELFSGGCGEAGSQEQEVPENDGDTDESTEEDARVTSKTSTRTESKPNLEDGTNETESSESLKDSVIIYILSSTIKLLFAPLSPLVSILTNLPSQICYVLQEDATVLASLPSDSFSLVRNLGSGVVSGVENVGSVAYQVGELSVSSLYTFLSTLVGALLLAFQEGLVGTGTLICDAVGLVVSALGELVDIAVKATVRTCCGVGRYVGAVGSEMGEQSLSIGHGVGKLAWRGQRGLGHVVSSVLGIIGGILGNTVENIQDAFRKE